MAAPLSSGADRLICMRVIAGKFRSRRLQSLKGLALRPTSDMLRETLFNILGPRVDGSHFLDLFAGTGAVGIEALSRGALSAVFVENHAAAVRLIRENIASLEIKSRARIIASAVAPALLKLEQEHCERARHSGVEQSASTAPDTGSAATAKDSAAFDFVFLDPPYANAKEYDSTLLALGKSSLVSDSTILIAEHHKKSALPESRGRLQQFRILTQGDASLSFYRLFPRPLS
jgi:16S rRNA (guanine966-N2)-methyltransferase